MRKLDARMNKILYKIAIGGKGVRALHNGMKSESAIFFRNVLQMSQGILATIVASGPTCS